MGYGLALTRFGLLESGSLVLTKTSSVFEKPSMVLRGRDWKVKPVSMDFVSRSVSFLGDFSPSEIQRHV
jgi:hypothetical protein